MRYCTWKHLVDRFGVLRTDLPEATASDIIARNLKRLNALGYNVINSIVHLEKLLPNTTEVREFDINPTMDSIKYPVARQPDIQRSIDALNEGLNDMFQYNIIPAALVIITQIVDPNNTVNSETALKDAKDGIKQVTASFLRYSEEELVTYAV